MNSFWNIDDAFIKIERTWRFIVFIWFLIQIMIISFDYFVHWVKTRTNTSIDLHQETNFCREREIKNNTTITHHGSLKKMTKKHDNPTSSSSKYQDLL